MDDVTEHLRTYDDSVPVWTKLDEKSKETTRLDFEAMIRRNLTLEQTEIAYMVLRAVFRNHYAKMIGDKPKGSLKQVRKPKIID